MRLACACLLALACVLATSSGRAQATKRCNAAPAGSESTYGNAGLTSLARDKPERVARMALPRVWLDAGLMLLRAPYQWGAPLLRLHVRPVDALSLEGTASYGLPMQPDLGAREGIWASGRLGVRVWKRGGESAWRFVLSACRASNYMPSGWEGYHGATGLPANEAPEPTRLDYVFVDVPVEHALWLDGAARSGWLSYKSCPGGDCGGISPAQPTLSSFVTTWAAGLRYGRFTAALLDDEPLRANLEVWGYMLFRPLGLLAGPVVADGVLLGDSDPSSRVELGAEVGARYTPWSFEWAQIELTLGYTPAVADLIIEAGFSFPIWLL